jgi:hypothetical protein
MVPTTSERLVMSATNGDAQGRNQLCFLNKHRAFVSLACPSCVFQHHDAVAFGPTLRFASIINPLSHKETPEPVKVDVRGIVQ